MSSKEVSRGSKEILRVFQGDFKGVSTGNLPDFAGIGIYIFMLAETEQKLSRPRPRDFFESLANL